MRGVKSKQLRQLVGLMAHGFMEYGITYGERKHVGAVTDDADQNRIIIFSCGAEFGAILNGRTDSVQYRPQLVEDLFNLIEGGCPVLDIIDLMFACTKGFSPAIPDRLESIGLGGPSLHLLRSICLLASDKISALNRSDAGPLQFLPSLLPELSEEDRKRLTHDILRLPDLIGLFGDLLNLYPPPDVSSPHFTDVLRNCEAVFFYMLLDHFKAGFPTLSCLLRAMRHARYSAFPTEKRLRRIAPREIVLSDQSKAKGRSNVRDPLGEMALQQRLDRFYKQNGNWQLLMQFWMNRYLSDEFSQHRASGEIFFSVLDRLVPSRYKPA